MAPLAVAVVGGTVPEDSLAFVAKIETAGRACTGVLVTPQWVLTASSCFAEAGGTVTPGAPKQATTATIGRTVLSSTKGRGVSVVELVPHENRNLVLARLQTRVDIAPVAIGITAPAAGDTLRVAGYGRTATEWIPNQLHAAAFTVQAVQASTVSVTGATSDAAICKGDAGGPALREANGRVELVAISSTSWQHGCFGETETRTGAVETRVDDLADWIGQHATHGGRGGDYNGDGRDDIVAGYDNLNTNTSFLGWRGAATGVSGSPETLWNSGDGNWANNQAKYVTGDFDGDGHGDVAAFYYYGGLQTTLFVSHGTDNGLAPQQVQWSSGPGNWDSGRAKYVAGDFNGDGKTDIAAFYYYDGGQTKLFLFTATANGFTVTDRWTSGAGNWENDRVRFTAGDFNGDGKADIAAFYSYSWGQTSTFVTYGAADGLNPPLWSTTGWQSPASGWDNAKAKYLPGDFNGDGKTDIAAFYYYGGGQTKLFLFAGTASGFSVSDKWTSGAGNWENDRVQFTAGDFNGDGRTDVAAFYSYSWGQTSLFLTNGTADGLNAPLWSTVGWQSPAGWKGERSTVITTSVN